VFCRTAVDQTVACSSGGGQAPEGSRTPSGHFQRHAYRHLAISQRTLENIDVRKRVHGRRSKRIIRQFVLSRPKSSRMASSLRLIAGRCWRAEPYETTGPPDGPNDRKSKHPSQPWRCLFPHRLHPSAEKGYGWANRVKQGGRC